MKNLLITGFLFLAIFCSSVSSFAQQPKPSERSFNAELELIKKKQAEMKKPEQSDTSASFSVPQVPVQKNVPSNTEFSEILSKYQKKNIQPIQKTGSELRPSQRAMRRINRR